MQAPASGDNMTRNPCNNYIIIPKNLVEFLRNSDYKEKVLNLVLSSPNKYGIFQVDYITHKDAIGLLTSLKYAKFYPTTSVLWLKYHYAPSANKRRQSTVAHTLDWLNKNCPEVTKDFVRYYDLAEVEDDEEEDVNDLPTTKPKEDFVDDDFQLVPKVDVESDALKVIKHYAALYRGRFGEKYPFGYQVEIKLAKDRLGEVPLKTVLDVLTFAFLESTNKWLEDKIGTPKILLAKNVFVNIAAEMRTKKSKPKSVEDDGYEII